MIVSRPRILVRPTSLRPTSSRMRLRGILNPSAIRLKDEKILLYARVAETPFHGERYFLSPQMIGKDHFSIKMEKIPRKRMKWTNESFVTPDGLTRLPTISHLRRVIVDSEAERVLSISDKPDFFGISGEGEFGVEDPRMVYFHETKSYAMSYVHVSERAGVSTSLATSTDLKHWKRMGTVFSQQNKDVVLFPQKVNGFFVALHRPEGTMNFNRPSIWISYSKDLEFWGHDKPLMHPRFDGWDSLKIGAGAPPIHIPEGFLEIYHGVSPLDPEDPESPRVYSAGAVVFDPKNPELILARSPKTTPLFSPELSEEKVGFVNNVAFPCGVVPARKNKELLVFSGAGDTAISVRRLQVKQILNSLTWFK